MVLFWTSLQLLPSIWLTYWLLLSSPRLLLFKIPLYSVEFNHYRIRNKFFLLFFFSCSFYNIWPDERSASPPSENLPAGFGFPQVPQASSIPQNTPLTTHLPQCFPCNRASRPLWGRSNRKSQRMLYYRSARKGEATVQLLLQKI